MDFCVLQFGRIVDKCKEYIKDIIVHPSFFFCYVRYLNIASYLCIRKVNKVKVGE